MKISVITVCKNAQDTIEETIQSVLAQTYSNIEFIIIDGLSADNTISIIEKYRDKISYFISEPDYGVYNAMNKAIKVSSGDYLYFLNANDVIYDDFILDRVVKELEKDKSLKYLFGDVLFVNKDEKKVTEIKYDFKDIFAFLNSNICHQCIFYHRDLFKKYGVYDESYKIYSDYDFNIRLLVQNRIKAKYLPMYIAKFSLGGISTNKSYKSIQKKEHKAILQRYFLSSYPVWYYGKIFDQFAKRYLGSLYKPIKNGELYQIFLGKLTSKPEYRLNIH